MRGAAGIPGSWLLPVLCLILNLVFQGCASRGDGGSGGLEDLLGREVTEGKVIEGSIEVPVDYSEDSEIKPQGYRVQVIASTVREEVEGVAEVVRGLFPFRVYIDHAKPFYKIRIGNFETRGEANKVREELVRYGFEDAWIVETTIEME